jgi:hypothetical protein
MELLVVGLVCAAGLILPIALAFVPSEQKRMRRGR